MNLVIPGGFLFVIISPWMVYNEVVHWMSLLIFDLQCVRKEKTCTLGCDVQLLTLVTLHVLYT